MRMRMYLRVVGLLVGQLVLGIDIAGERRRWRARDICRNLRRASLIWWLLEESLTQTGELAEILKKGNDELSEAIKAYQSDPTVAGKDRVYVLLGDLAGQTVKQIEGIVSNKDKIKDGLSEIVYKMDRIKLSLGEKQETFSKYAEEIVKQAGGVKDELRKLAKAIKKDPENKVLRREFRRKLFELRNLDNRNKTYRAHQRLNQKFGEQVELAQQFFTQLDANMEQVDLESAREEGLLGDARGVAEGCSGDGVVVYGMRVRAMCRRSQ